MQFTGHVDDSPYALADLESLAAAASADALQGRHSDGDPILATLYAEASQFMHGACALLASHLQESRGMPVILIQGMPPGQSWMTRHAMACRCTADEAAALVAEGRGFEVPVLDAAGAGSVGDRLALYRQEGWDFRAILGRDPDCSSRWMWEPNPKRPASNQEGTLHRLPALAHALGLPFDLRDALAGILADLDEPPPGIEESGLPEWLGMQGQPSP